MSLAPAKVGKQFQTAEALSAQMAIVVGAEFPALKLKSLSTRVEETIHRDAIVDALMHEVGKSRRSAE